MRHFYSGHPWLDPEIQERGIDELTPIWNILDSDAARSKEVL